MIEIGTYLKQVRDQKKITIRQLANYTGISPAYISQIENNSRTSPKPYVLQSLCEGLGINYNDFLIKTGQMSVEEVEERKSYYAENIASLGQDQIMESAPAFSPQERDLFVLLKDEESVFYKQKQLDNEERKKVCIMLQMLLE